MVDMWVNQTPGVPTVADFATTRGAGAPLCVDNTSGLLYYLGSGDIVTPVSADAGFISPAAYGVVTSGSAAANSAALAVLTAALTAGGYANNSVYIGVKSVQWGLGNYDLADTIDFNFGTGVFSGLTTGGPGANGTILTFAADTTGIRTQRIDTSGNDTTDGIFHVGGDGSIISHLCLIGSGTDPEAHGFHLRAKAYGHNLRIHGFPGNGINIVADVNPGPAHGNANCSGVRDSRVTGCLNGIVTSAGDANACVFSGLDLSSNLRFGIWENSFLGNLHTGFHTDGNGLIVGSNPSICHLAGGRYGVIWGEEAWCKLNPPTGTIDDNQGWYYQGAAGIDPGNNIADWASGTDYVAGGAILCKGQPNNCSVFMAGYYEGGQGNPQVDAPSMILGGVLSTIRNIGNAPVLSAKSGAFYLLNTGLEADLSITTHGNITADGNTPSVGPTTGALVNTILTMNATADYNEIAMYSHNGGTFKVVGIGSQRGVGSYIDLTTTVGGTHRFLFNGGGITTFQSGAILINGTQVLGVQQTGCPAAATDPATTMALANYLRTALLAHGVVHA